MAIYFRVDPTKYSADVELIPVKLNVEAYTGFLDGKSSGDWVYLKASCRGVQLMTEVVLFDVTNGIAELWVNMLSLSSTEPEFIKLEYASTDQTTRSLADLSDDFSGEVGSPANPLLWTRRNHYSELQYLRSATVHEHISGGYKMGVFPAASGTWEMEQIYGNVVLVDEFDVELEVDLTYAGSTFQCQLWLIRSYYDSIRWGHNAQTTLFGQTRRDGYTGTAVNVSPITANLSSIKYRITRDASDNIDYYYDVGAGWVHAGQDPVAQPNGLVPQISFWDNGGAGTEYAIIKNFTINSCANRSSGLTSHRSSSYNAGGVWGVDCLVAVHFSDDPSGGVYNSSPNRSHFTSSGSMTSGDVVDDDTFFGKSIDFDGGNDFIRSNEIASILDDINSYSIGLTALWSGRRDGTSADAAWQFTGASSGGLFKAVHSGDAGYFGISSSISSSETTYNLGISGKGANKRLIMALNYKYPAATCDVYSDGAFVRQQTGCNRALWPAAARFSIAQEYDSSATPSDLWDGTINEVIMYYNPKTAEWIEAMSANFAGELATIVGLPQIEVTIDHTQIDVELTNFPYRVYLPEGILDLDSVLDWKYLHATVDGVECFIEVEEWDTTTNKVILWVRVPTISATEDTVISFSFGEDNYEEELYNYMAVTTPVVIEDFTGINGDNPNLGKWTVTEGSPNILNNALFGEANNSKESICSNFRFTGDFDVQVDFEILDDPNLEIFEMKFVASPQTSASDSLTDLAQIIRVYTSEAPSGADAFGVNAKINGSLGTGVYDDCTANSGQLRMVREDDTLTFYYKEDGDSEWTELDDRDISGFSSSDPLRIHLIFSTNSALTSFDGAFDNFQINSCDKVSHGGVSATILDFDGDNGDAPDQGLWQNSPSTTGTPFAIQSNKLYGSATNLEVVTLQSRFKLEGDFDVEVPFDSFSSDDYSTMRAYMSGGGSAAMIGMDTSSGNQWQATFMTSSVWGSTTRTSRTNNYGGLRWIRSGSTLTMYAKDGSGGWVSKGSTTVSTDPFNLVFQISTTSGDDAEGNFVEVQINSCGGITKYIGETTEPAAQVVWDENFMMVCHMNQDPSGGADCILDSTSNRNHGTPSGMVAGDLVDGVNGASALDFDGGTSNAYVNCGGASSLDDITLLTVDCMVNARSFGDGNTGRLVQKALTNQGWFIYAVGSATVSPPIEPSTMGFWRSYNSVTTYHNCRAEDAPFLLDTPVFFSLTHDSAVYSNLPSMQFNGVEFDVLETAGASAPGGSSSLDSDASQDLWIGARNNAGTSVDKEFDGAIWEVRISNVLRSDVWRKATYKSLLSALGSCDFASVCFAIDSDKIDSNLTDFPLKVVLDSDFMAGLDENAWKYLHIADYDTGEEFYIEKEMWAPNELGIVHALIPAISATEQTAFTVKVTSESNYLRRVLEAEVFDDFSGTDDDPPYEGKWLVNNGTPTIQSNKLRFDADSGNALERIFSKFILSGNFDVQITVLMDDDPETSRWAVSFGLADEVTSKPYRLFRGYRTDLTNFNHFAVYEDTAYTEDVAATSLSFDLRIVRIGNFHFYYYDIGAGWVLLDSNDISAANDMKLEIYFQSADGFPTIGGVVTDFQINSCDGITGFIGEAGELQAQNVWRGMFGVWNLAQDAGSGNLLDSTPNENDGTPNGLVAADLVETDYGYAQQFSGAVAERISFGNLGLDGADDYTVLMFVIPESVSGTQLYISSRTTSKADSREILFQLHSTDDDLIASLRDSDPDTVSLDSISALVSSTPILMGLRKTTDLDFIIDGAIDDSGSIAAIGTIDSEVVSIGQYWDDATNTWLTSIVPTAKIIQVVILTEGMTDAWIKAYYNSVMGSLLEDYVAPVVEGGFGSIKVGSTFLEVLAANVCINGQWVEPSSLVVLQNNGWKEIL
jgi:hypothetical protein